MSLSTKKWAASTFALAIGMAASAHPCMLGRISYRLSLSGQGGSLTLHCVPGESIELTLVPEHSQGSESGISAERTSLAVGLDSRGYRRLPATRATDGSESIQVQLDAAEGADLLERMQRAHVARVRFDPAGPEGEALATFEIGSHGDALEWLASGCSSAGLLDYPWLTRSGVGS